MMHDTAPPCDALISYSPADRQWVEGWLLPHLENAGVRVAIDFRDFIIGMPRLVNIEQAVEQSRRVIVVLSPDWLAGELNDFEASLARYADPAARRRKLLPLLYRPCDLPESIKALRLEPANFLQEKNWERECKRLVRDIQDSAPVRVPVSHEGIGTFDEWKHWIRHNRRPLVSVGLALVLIWLLASAALGLPPFFAPRAVWKPLALNASDKMTEMTVVGETILVGGINEQPNCDYTNVLWLGSNKGANWQQIDAPLCFTHPTMGRVLADIRNFAVGPQGSKIVYASTSNVGLLKSEDGAQSWKAAGDSGLPTLELAAVAADPANPARVWVGARNGGLYRSENAGATWKRLDLYAGGNACPAPSAPLAKNLIIGDENGNFGALVAASQFLVVGTGNPNSFRSQDEPVGLYYSRDGGECWSLVADDHARLDYLELAAGPAASAGEFLVLARDYDATPDTSFQGLLDSLGRWLTGTPNSPERNPYTVALVDVTAATPRRKILWSYENPVGALAVSGDRWYAITRFGDVFQGAVESSPKANALPRVPFCLFDCNVALAPINRGEVLVLAGGRVLTLDPNGSWYRSWFP